MEQPDLLNQVFLRYYEIPTDFDKEPQIAALKIVGVHERNREGEITYYETVALRDDKRPKRVGDKVRTISVAALTNNWVVSDNSVALSDQQIYNESLERAKDFLATSTSISESQASAIVSVIADMTSRADKRKLDRAKNLIEKVQAGTSASIISIAALIGR